MARIRKFVAYRRLERPYTRISKYRAKSYVRVRPHSTISKYEMGDPNKKFTMRLRLISKTNLQIRHNALEAARQTCNRLLEKTLGKNGYYLKLRAYPHHILRENPLASGAGADRMSTGMAGSFGKAIGSAARVFKDGTVMTVDVNKEQMAVARQSLRRAYTKLPASFSITAEEITTR